MEAKKLIEVALPLEKINAASAREKSIRHGHPSTLHLWWARRPLAAARAVIWASLVDDPSSHPEQFPTTEEQNDERERLFHILENLVVWENSNNEDVLNQAKAEILKSTGNNPPALLDPFAGGGAIPLEAQRLGLEAHAHDLNPVAVMINKAMIEIPPRFAGQKPVNPEARKTLKDGWVGAGGLAEDVRYFGEWMKRKAFERIGHLYPKVKVPKEQGGGEATVIAWIWARTVTCPNPACGCEMPLASSFVLSKKKGKEAYISPNIEGKRISYTVHYGKGGENCPKIATGKFKCICCGEPLPQNYTKQESKAGRMGATMLAIVAEGAGRRIYLSPSLEQSLAAECEIPENVPTGELSKHFTGGSCVPYGLDEFHKLFTPRQLTALTTFSDLVAEAQAQAEADAVAAGLDNDHISLSDGGTGARAYGEAVGVYLGFLVDQIANHSSNVCGWNSVNAQLRNTFGRQAIPMVWDYAECNIFSNSSGSFSSLFDRMIKGFSVLGNNCIGHCKQADARSDSGLRNIMVSTDPPYYDNISYANLSDFFYIWMRRSLKNTFPNLFHTMLVPKTEELIATPYRHDGSKEKAKQFFEDGMLATCKQVYQYAREDIPVTIYYAYKQSDAEDIEGTASSGWETMLNSIVQAGFAITGTWPMRTEKEGRMIGNGTNALASSIVLVCRKRSESATMTTRRNFINTLKRELRPALQKLQSSNIAPVDLAQSAIGPGMGVFSRFSQVLEADGSPMTVRSALKIINQELDLYFNEQDGELDSESRFCVDLYTQYAFNDMKFGDANTLATAKNTSVAIMASHGTLYAQKGVVRLMERPELPGTIDARGDNLWLLCQQLTFRMEKEGIEGVARAIASLHSSNTERAKDLAYRLYTIAEKKKWQQEAYAYNSLVVAWPEIQTRASQLKSAAIDQISMYGEEG